MLQIQLPQSATKRLLAQDPATEKRGGFQKLIISLRRQVDESTGILQVTDSQIEKVRRYRKKYGGGGWQNILDPIWKQASRED